VNQVSVLTGEIQSGKTSLCLALVEEARKSGYKIGGLLSPAVYQRGEKTGIDVLDLKTSRRRRLAELNEGQSSDLETIHWAFLPEAVEWGNQALLQAFPCDLLLIDELGPLEFNRGEGWVNGFEAIRRGEFQAALVVVRHSLLEEAHQRWDISRTIDLSDPSRVPLSSEELCRLLLGN